MINRPTNWDSVKEPGDFQKIEPGAHVCRILACDLGESTWGPQLTMHIDIAEGPFKGYYQEEYDTNTFDNKKYRGVLRVWVPKNDGSEDDKRTVKTFKGFIRDVERSNPGYHWNWDEKSLLDLEVGVLFREEEWYFNGKHGFAVRPFRTIVADRVRNGDFTIPKRKEKDPPEDYAPAPSYQGLPQYQNPVEQFGEDESGLPF